MSASKYHNVRRNKEPRRTNSEVIGIVLVAISAFILICTIIPPILGVISSQGVFPVFIGIFGVFNYPLFLCTLILGIAFIRGITPELPTRQKVGIAIMAISLMIILQLATTHNRLGDFNGYGEYLNAVFKGGWDTPKFITAGGALFGILAYALQALITEVAAYIVCSVLFLAALGYFFIWPIYASRKAANDAPTANNNGQFEKGGDAYPREFMPVTDNTLFVERIIPPQYNGNPGAQANQMVQNTRPNQPFQQIERAPAFDPYHSPNPSNDSAKSSARQILFGSSAEEASQPRENPRSIRDEATEAFWAEHSMRPLSAEPTVKDTTVTPPPQQTPYQQRPAKRVHDDARAAFGDVTLPPPDDISDRIVGTEGIINGDDYSVMLAEENASRRQSTTDYERPQVGEFNSRNVEFSKVESVEPEEKPSSRIVNGDYFSAPKSVQTPQAPLVTQASHIKADYTVPSNEIEEQPLDDEYKEDTNDRPPIIAASEYEIKQKEEKREDRKEQSAETRFQMLLEEDRKRHATAAEASQKTETSEPLTYNFDLEDESYDDEYDVSAYDKILDSLDEATNEEIDDLILDDIPIKPQSEVSKVEIEDEEPIAEEPLSEDEILTEAQEEEGGLNIIEETVDLSEQSHFEGTDNTGYYEEIKETPNEEVKEAPKKPERPKATHLGDQIQIDDYMVGSVPPPKPKKKKRLKYNAPSIDMLTPASANAQVLEAATEDRARILEEALLTFKLPAKVTGIVIGPAVTRYELEMPPGVSVKRIEQLSQDLAYNLGCKGNIRVEAPVRGKKAVGVEVPNDSVDIVRLREVLESKEFKSSSSPLTLAIGKDITGNVIVCNLEKMPHLLIAGATNSGKSACLNSIIMSILYKASPDDVRLILIDPKLVEFALYDQMPHLLGDGIINDTQQAINALTWAREEMERRYHAFSALKVKNIAEYNKSEMVKSGQADKLQYIVMIVDEFAELTIDTENRKALENRVVSMAQKARAAGIHLILATQRPSADVITGTIRANLPSCIAFAVRSYTDSRIILDAGGAETLLGKGDMLYSPAGADGMLRVQGAYVESDDITAITEYVRANNETDFDEEFTAAIRKTEEETTNESDDDEKEFDPLMPEVLKCVIESGRASTSMVQSRFSVGYARANRIIDQMEIHKFIGPRESNNFRPVYITREEYKKLFGTDI